MGIEGGASIWGEEYERICNYVFWVSVWVYATSV